MPDDLHIDARRVVKWVAGIWVAIEVSLLIFDYHVNYAGPHIVAPIRALANLGREDSLANLLAVIQVMLLALTLWLVYVTIRNRGGTRWQRTGWLVAACMFSYMAIDDGSRLHERVGSTAHKLLAAWADRSGGDFSFPSYTWQLVYLPMFGALGLFTLYFFWSELSPKYSRVLIVLGIGCFVAAVGMDFVEGLSPAHRFNPYTWLVERVEFSEFARRRFHAQPYDAVRHFSKALEETTEMFGTTLIWLAVLRHWFATATELRVRVAS